MSDDVRAVRDFRAALECETRSKGDAARVVGLALAATIAYALDAAELERTTADIEGIHHRIKLCLAMELADLGARKVEEGK